MGVVMRKKRKKKGNTVKNLLKRSFRSLITSGMATAATPRNTIIRIVRFLLVFSVISGIAVIAFQFFLQKKAPTPEFLDSVSENIELMLWAALTLALSFLPDYFEKRARIHLPLFFETAIVVFIYSGIFLSVRFDLYYRFFWWDDLLHAASGLIIGFIGVMFIYIINRRYGMNLSPVLVAVFSFSFALSIGVLWEIIEFTLDVFMGSAHQKWDLPENAVLLGKHYQGSGLRDTMTDLIVDGIGAFIASITSYFIYKNDRRKTLKALRGLVE